MKMSFVTFSTQMGRLEKVFGEKPFLGDRTENIWDAVKELSENWFIGFINKILNTCRQPPLPFDFIEAARIEKQNLGIYQNDPIGTCGDCNDGLIHAFKRNEKENPYVFKCHCHIGNQRRERYPIWNEYFLSKFESMNLSFYKKDIDPNLKSNKRILELVTLGDI